MAGTFVHLTFTNRAASCADLAERLQAFAATRMSLERVRRLEGNQPIFGQRPSEWQAAGVTPRDLELADEDWYRDVVDSDEQATIEAALERWSIGPWVGLCAQYRLPPGVDGFPAIVGSCWWRLWAGADGTWRHGAAIEYPMSSVRNDPRWAGWLAAFISAAEIAFDATCSHG